MSKPFNEEVIMNFLCGFGVDGKHRDLIELAKQYLSEGTVEQRMQLQGLVNILKRKQWISVSENDVSSLGMHTNTTDNWDNRQMKVRLENSDYCKPTKEHGGTVNNITIQDSYGFNLFSPNATINIDQSRSSEIINEIRNAVTADINVNADLRRQSLVLLDKADRELKSGKIEQSTIKQLLDVGSKFAGIGSLIVNLLRLFAGG